MLKQLTRYFASEKWTKRHCSTLCSNLSLQLFYLLSFGEKELSYYFLQSVEVDQLVFKGRLKGNKYTECSLKYFCT